MDTWFQDRGIRDPIPAVPNRSPGGVSGIGFVGVKSNRLRTAWRPIGARPDGTVEDEAMIGSMRTLSRAQGWRTRPALECLESLSRGDRSAQPTAVEQLLLERLDDLRANPVRTHGRHTVNTSCSE